jgi:hypothetical protein
MAQGRRSDWNEAALEAIRQVKAAWAERFTGRAWDRYRCLRATVECQPGHPTDQLLRARIPLACRPPPMVKDHTRFGAKDLRLWFGVLR